MAEETLNPAEKNKNSEEKNFSLKGEQPLRIEPKENIPPSSPVNSSKTREFFPDDKHLEKKQKAAPSLGNKPETALPQVIKKSSPFFSFLFILSLIFMALTVALLILPLVSDSTPAFIMKVINVIPI